MNQSINDDARNCGRKSRTEMNNIRVGDKKGNVVSPSDNVERVR
jgi:hypothetical protein